MPHTDPTQRSRIARAAVAAREAKRTRSAQPEAAAVSSPRKRNTPDKPARGKLATISDYDRALGRPANWGDAKRREEVRGELVLNQARAEDLASKRTANAKARGELLDLAAVERRDEARDAIFQAALGAAVDLVSELSPPAQLQAARARAVRWIDEQRAAIATKLEAAPEA